MAVSNLLTAAKYGFFVLTVTGAGYLIALNTVIKRVKVPDSLTLSDIAHLPYESSQAIVDWNFARCLSSPLNPFCLKTAHQRRRALQENATHDGGDNTTTALPTPARPHPLHDLLENFRTLMLSVDVRSFLIEPSALFCVLGPSAKIRLLTDGFVPTRFPGYKNTIAFGIMQEDARKLDKETVVKKLLNAGFEVSRSRRWQGPWPQKSKDTLHTTHYFFVRGGYMVHAVVFFVSGNFFWHAGLPPGETKSAVFSHEAAYEQFEVIPLGNSSVPGLNIPSDPQFFLLQLESSRYVEHLEYSGLEHFQFPAPTHPELTELELVRRVFVAIEDLKNRLRPEGISFWLRGHSLLGWYLEGQLFSRTTGLHLAAFFRTHNDSSIEKLFHNNEFLKLKLRLRLDEQDYGYRLDCHGMFINFLIAREDSSGRWIFTDGEHRQKKFVYASPKLCSADVIAEKMLVPCKPVVALKAEFGEDWVESSNIEEYEV